MEQIGADRLRILVADDHASIRENLRYLFNAEPDMHVVGVARNGDEVLEQLTFMEPDVLVLDHAMPGGASGMGVLAEMRRRGLRTRVVVFTMSTEVCDAARAAGAAACLAKDAPYDTILQAVRAAGVFSLPDPTEARSRRTVPAAHPPVPGRARVLVVDDDVHIRGLVATALEDEGFETRAVANGAQALEESVRWSPRVIVLDMLMPVMDGRQFVQVYRHVPNGSAKIVALTALSRASGIAKELGVDAGLAKPFDVDTLVRTVTTLAS